MNALHVAVVAVLAAQIPTHVAPNGETIVRRRTITTANPVAQQHFDRGLELVYAAKPDDAVRAFRTARRIDPTCAMCYWGEALALGPRVEGQMSAANDSAAQAAIRKAVFLAPRVSSHERAYIRALARRYGPDAVATRAQRDTAYAKALGEIVFAFPDDVDAKALYAEAQLLVSAGTASSGGARSPSALGATASLGKALDRSRNNAGAPPGLAYVAEGRLRGEGSARAE